MVRSIMAKREVIEKRLKLKNKQLEIAYDAYTQLLSGGVKSYAIGSRNLSKFDLPQLEETIHKLESEVETLEGILNGASKRKAIRVLPRDL